MICPCGECPRNVAAASWQRTRAFLANDSHFLGQTPQSCDSTGSLLSRDSSLRFSAVPPPENAAERYSIWVMRQYYTEHDGEAVLHSQRGIPEMLRTMKELLWEVCSVTRRLLQSWLGLQVSKRINVFFPATGRIFFEQSSYTTQSLHVTVICSILLWAFPIYFTLWFLGYSILLYPKLSSLYERSVVIRRLTSLSFRD
jgi:hypothetical protein